MWWAVLNGATGQARLFLDGQQVAGPKDDKPASDAFVLSRAYALQRYINACAGRGAYPIKFNGSIFTVDGIENDQESGARITAVGGQATGGKTRACPISAC